MTKTPPRSAPSKGARPSTPMLRSNITGDDEDDLQPLEVDEDDDEVEAPAEDQPEQVNETQAPAPIVVKKATREPTTLIRIHDNPDIPPSGVFISGNGRAFLVQAGAEVEVPDVILSVLNSAVQGKPVVNPQTRQVDGFTESLRYPYSVLRARKVVTPP